MDGMFQISCYSHYVTYCSPYWVKSLSWSWNSYRRKFVVQESFVSHSTAGLSITWPLHNSSMVLFSLHSRTSSKLYEGAPARSSGNFQYKSTLPCQRESNPTWRVREGSTVLSDWTASQVLDMSIFIYSVLSYRPWGCSAASGSTPATEMGR